MEDRVFKDINLNEEIEVTVKMSAGQAIQTITSYSTTEWACDVVNDFMKRIHDAILSPVFIREREAELQLQQDQAQMQMQQFLGQRPDFPPHWPGAEQ